MEITLRIPDDVARRLSDASGDVSRRALEALALEGYRDRILTLYQISNRTWQRLVLPQVREHAGSIQQNGFRSGSWIGKSNTSMLLVIVHGRPQGFETLPRSGKRTC